MSRQKLFWQVFVFYISLLLLSLVLVHIFAPGQGFFSQYSFFRLLFVFAILGGVAWLASLFLTRRLSEPLDDLKHASLRFARGDLSPVFLSSETEEVLSLAEVMNQMARQWQEKFQAISNQRNQQEAVLTSMVEGVLALDVEGRLMSLNEAAVKLLRIYQKNYEGKTLQEVIRNVDLQNFVEETLASDVAIEGEITLHNNGDRFIKAQGTNLKNMHGDKIGILIVLHDITKIRRLESLRKDFVANVSHELKTPLTSIKGFVEALLDDDHSDPGHVKKFLGIISKQTERLNEIIEDLLSLSKIERESDANEIQLQQAAIQPILFSAVDICRARWSSRKPEIILECDEDLKSSLNSRLFEQAVINLIDNAIKYSDEGKPVRVKAFSKAREAVVQVVDQGGGIEEEHLPRLFERFYRIDKARSREIGGSGLGLAIVKHIMQAHGGYVTVRSVLQQGSEFSLHIPLTS